MDYLGNLLSLIKPYEPLFSSYISLFQLQYNSAKKSIFSYFKSQFSEFDIIDIIIIYSILILILYQCFKVFRFFYNNGFLKTIKIYLFIFIIKKIPFGKKKFQQEVEKIEKEFSEDIDKFNYKKILTLPKTGMKIEQIQDRLTNWQKNDENIINSGKLSGSKYVEGKEFEKNLKEFSKEFAFHNLLHFDYFHSSRQMEAEVIHMTGNLLSSGKEVYGTTTSGGTESLCLALYTYREWARVTKGITEPEAIVPVTVHVALDKASQYFNIKLVKIGLDPITYKADLKQLKRSINKNTICIVGSAPNFPHGIMDPIPQMAHIAQKNKIGMHVDGCLGGFLIAFAKDNGLKIDDFDFSVSGVTSISIDHHKYGLAPKGVSALLYKTKELRRFQYFCSSSWNGGIYATTSTMGSRSGIPIAGAWFSLLHLGYPHFKEQAGIIFKAIETVKNGIKNKIPELQVIGDPKICAIAFTSNHKKVSIYILHQLLGKKGWNLTALQSPEAIHFGLTAANAKKCEEFIQDLSQCVEELKQGGDHKKGGAAAIYGTAKQIPDVKIVEEVSKVVMDCALKI